MTTPSIIIPIGFCHCGCGQKTKIASKTFAAKGRFKGQPLRYINGHNGTTPREYPSHDPAENFRFIPLSQGQFAKVSPHRFDELNKFRWMAHWAPNTQSFYAIRETSSQENPPQRTIHMHREILNLGRQNDKRTGDHVNHDTLDNRDENLRVCNYQEQSMNRRLRKNNRSGYKGITQVGNKWRAWIYLKGKRRELGLHETPEAAHAAYVEAAKEMHGEFHCAG